MGTRDEEEQIRKGRFGSCRASCVRRWVYCMIRLVSDRYITHGLLHMLNNYFLKDDVRRRKECSKITSDYSTAPE